MRTKRLILIPLFVLSIILAAGLAVMVVMIVVLIIITLQGGTVSWFPQWILSVLPAPSEKNDFIGSLGTLATILFVVLGAVGTFIRFAWGQIGWKSTNLKDDESPLRQITLEELRERPGVQGGRVNWIDRGATKPGDLRTHGRIVITGRMKLGKTREAVELIRLAIADDQVKETRIYEPGSMFRFFNREKLQEQLKGIDPRESILLFLDDFPYHYSGESLERLTDLLQGLKACKTVLIVATARLDQLTNEHRAWLKTHQLHDVPLPTLTADQTGQLVNAASGIFDLQIDAAAQAAFAKNSDGTPECSLISLRRLRSQGISQVTGDLAEQVASQSLAEAWSEARRYILEKHPTAEYLFDSLAIFHTARVTPYTNFVIAYARQLWINKHPWQAIRGTVSLKQALIYLASFDIVEQNDKVLTPDVVTEGQISPEAALLNLGNFLLGYRRLFQLRLLRPLYPYANLHAWALFDLARNLYVYGKRNYPFTIRLYSVALRFDIDPPTYSNRGLTYYEMKDYPAALADYNKAIQLRPDYVTAYNNRGLIYYEMKDYVAALADYNKAIQLQPDYPNAYNNRGLTYTHMNDYAAALADHNKAIQLQPDYANAYHNRGTTYDYMKDYPAALTDYNKAIQLQPEDVTTYNNRGLTYDHMKDYPAALADYNKAIQLQPEDATSYSNRGTTYAHMKDYPAALADYNKAIQLQPDYFNAYNNRGLTYDYMKDYPAALADYNKAIQLRPEDATSYSNRGTTYAQMKDYSAALADYNKAIQLQPEDAITYSNRGTTYTHMKDYSAALADYNKVIRLQPDNSTPIYNIACLYGLQTQSVPACVWLRHAIQVSLGYLQMAKTDSDFDSIRDTPEFQALLGEFSGE